MAKRMAVFWGAGADSDDVVQEAFVKAYAALPRFRSDGEFRPWLLCIVSQRDPQSVLGPQTASGP
jgi:DNA-directed RNA polymerase specialized sigma24 family protein